MTESERVARFEAAYNRIDRALTGMVSGGGGNRRKHGFAAKVRIAAGRRRNLARYVDFLLEIGELRNALVHGRTDELEYLAVPNESTVLELERIEQAAFSPEKVLPRFARNVVTLQPQQPIIDAWRLVRTDGYSRYPVYDARGEYLGLLTANGLARWAASRLNGSKLELDAANVTVLDVLERDHRRSAVEFVSRNTLIDDVDELFQRTKPLEAVIITEHGTPNEPPLGMICARDLVAVKH